MVSNCSFRLLSIFLIFACSGYGQVSKNIYCMDTASTIGLVISFEKNGGVKIHTYSFLGKGGNERMTYKVNDSKIDFYRGYSEPVYTLYGKLSDDCFVFDFLSKDENHRVYFCKVKHSELKKRNFTVIEIQSIDK